MTRRLERKKEEGSRIHTVAEGIKEAENTGQRCERCGWNTRRAQKRGDCDEVCKNVSENILPFLVHILSGSGFIGLHRVKSSSTSQVQLLMFNYVLVAHGEHDA